MNCRFCVYLRKEDVIAQTNNYILYLGKGMICPGHVMLLTKKHYEAFALIPKEMEEEFFNLKKIITQRIKKEFYPAFIIECGKWGQSIPHAHMHFIPKKSEEYTIDNIIDEMVRPKSNGVPHEIIDEDENLFNKLREYYNCHQGYFLINENNSWMILPADKIPKTQEFYEKGFLTYRRFFTKKGVKGILDWSKMSETDLIRDENKKEITRKKLKNIFKQSITKELLNHN